jgi:3-deoxy-D-manno-octulosonic-acid transferase
MYRIYTLVFRLGLIVSFPYYLVRFQRYLPTLSDRLGFLKLPPLQHTIWVHAVSVGEVKAVEKLIERMREEFPHHPVVVSTATPTGQQLARERHDIIDQTFYFPLDTPGAMRRVLKRVQPDLVIVAETEIWPNFLRVCRQRNVPVMMINGRISDKSFPRYRRARRWLGRVLDDYAVLGMQSETDRERIESIGANPSRVTVFGNLKYDVTPLDRGVEPKLAAFLQRWQELWIAASTMPGEDELVLEAFLALKKTHPLLKLMIAPRHPDRSNAIAELVRARGLRGVLRSTLDGDGDVLILDTIGELSAAFQFACVVFMGGSLVERGGHNVLEPARHSKPVVFGPHMENFRDIARLFLDAGAAIQIPNAQLLAPTVERILTDSALAAALGRNAHQVVINNTGATDRVIAFIRSRNILKTMS